ncbi:MAG: DNA polymerase III subunit beta [Elusimicrobia bacterium]|nr:DNA polymerase III subunit beta [Elusimicrobiota bacterium]
MKINFTADELSKGVQTIQAALSSRTTLPILLNFLIETEKSKVKLVSTDLQMGVKHYIKAEIENEGSVTIPAKKFSDILHTLPADQDVRLSMDDENRVVVKCGRSRFVINGSPKSEYPVLPEFNSTAAFTVPGAELADMVKRTIFAASSDETRYVLNGVFWKASGGQLELVATDGRRLALARRDILPKDKEFRAIIPTKVLAELQRLTGAADGDAGPVQVAITENQVAFQTPETTMISRLVEGSFPNYEQVVPAKKDISLIFDTKALSTITKQAALCSQDRGGSVKFALRKGVLHVSASSQTLSFEDELAADYKGAEFVIAFNPQYVLEGLKAMGTDKVRLSLTTPVNPALFEPEGGSEGYRYVVMPMRA